MSDLGFFGVARISGRQALVATILTIVTIALTPVTVGATAHLWLYPDSEAPNAGGHIVTEPAFTLNIENRGSGSGDNTAYDSVLLVAVNDLSVFTGAAITLPGGTVSLDPGMLTDGIPSFDCSDATVPPHGVYPSYFAEIPVGNIAAGEIVAAGVVINGADGLEVHFDVTATGTRQAGPQVRCYDVMNPSGHDVTVVFEDPGTPPCHELAITKIAGSTGVAVNDPMDYDIVVENTGTCELTEVWLAEDIPTVPDPQGQPVPAFSVTAIDPSPTNQTTAMIEWDLGTLAPGDVITVTLSVVFDEPEAAGLTVVNTACVTSFELPDPACASASVEVGEAEGDEIGGPGFWCNQLRFTREGRPNAQFTTAELDAWLLAIFGGSAIFPEEWPLAGLADAELMLCRPNLGETMADRLARHLLALWFNVASERVPDDTELGDLCPGDEESPPGMDPEMTIAGLIFEAEADIAAGAGQEELGFWLEVVDFVNNARLPGAGGCDGETVRRSDTRRRGGNRP